MTSKTKNTARTILSTVLLLLILTPAFRAHALQTSFSVLNFTPTTDNSPYFTVYGSKLLSPRQFNMGFYFNYSYKPLECVGCPNTNVINSLMVGDFHFAIGATSRIQVGFSIPIILYNEFNDDFTGTPQDDGGFGDVHFEPKIRLLDIERHNIGLSLLPFITLPTGDGQQFLGNGSVTGGGKLILDGDVNRLFGMSLNLGYAFRDDVTRTSTQIDDEFTYGLGMVGHASSHWDVFGEITGYSVVQNLFGSVAQSPLEVEGGARYFMDSGFSFCLGAGGGIIDGVGSPKLRGILGINFAPPLSKQLTTEARARALPHAEIKENKIVVSDRIYFDFNKSALQSKSYAVLDAVADLLKHHPEVTLLQVEGHTDSVGSNPYNQRLSDARAKVAMHYLVEKGIAPNRLTYKGFSASQPLAPNSSEEGQALNRRTEFTILERGK